MLLTLSQEKLNVIVCSGGCYRRLIFNPMPEERARQLVREYGYRPEEVCSMQLKEMIHQTTVDDLIILEWLDQKRTYLHLSGKDICDVVRLRFPNLRHIGGVRQFVARYNQLISLGRNEFLVPMQPPCDTSSAASGRDSGTKRAHRKGTSGGTDSNSHKRPRRKGSPKRNKKTTKNK